VGVPYTVKTLTGLQACPRSGGAEALPLWIIPVHCRMTPSRQFVDSCGRQCQLNRSTAQPLNRSTAQPLIVALRSVVRGLRCAVQCSFRKSTAVEPRRFVYVNLMMVSGKDPPV
jgi:hypothetical protein